MRGIGRVAVVRSRRRRRRPSLEFLCLMQAHPLSRPSFAIGSGAWALEKLGTASGWVDALGTVRGGAARTVRTRGRLLIVAGRQSPLPRLQPATDGHPTTLRHPCHGPTTPIAHHPTLTTGSPPWFAHCPKCTTTGLCPISRSPLPGPSLRATGASSRCCSRQMLVMYPKLGGRHLLTCIF